MKGKISGAKLQAFFLAHGEKLAVGVVVVAFLWMIYGALGVESYDKTPDDLAQVIQRATTHIDRTVAPAELTTIINADGALVVKEYDKWAEGTKDPVNPQIAEAGQTVWSPGSSSAGRRPAPELFAVEQLRAAGANGAFALKMTEQERQAREAERQRIVELQRTADLEETDDNERRRTGDRPGRRTPVMEERYDNNLLAGDAGGHFANAPGEPLANMPEPPLVKPSADDKAQGYRWVVLTGLVPVTKQAAEYRAKFEESGYYSPNGEVPEYDYFEVERAEVIPGQAVEDRNWAAVDVVENTLPVEAKFTNTFPVDCDSLYQDDALTRPLPPLLGRNWGENVVHAPMIKMMRQDGRVVNEPLKNEDPLAAPAQVTLESFDPDSPFGNPGGSQRRGVGHGGSRVEEGGRRQGLRGHGGAAIDSMSGQTAEYSLFRFFDYSVEPGKNYVYRVRLRMRNPNYQVPKQYLESAELGDAMHSYTSWSELPEPVAVPRDNDLQVGGVAPPRGVSGPSVKVIIENFDFAQGIKASSEFNLQRGAVAGDRQHSVQVIDPISQQIQEKKLDFLTGAVVLDIVGGERMGERGRDSAPGMVLLLDEAGNLVVREELADQGEYDQSRAELDRIDKVVNPPMTESERESR